MGEYHCAGCDRLPEKSNSVPLADILDETQGEGLFKSNRYPCRKCKPYTPRYGEFYWIGFPDSTMHHDEKCSRLQNRFPSGISMDNAIVRYYKGDKFCGWCCDEEDVPISDRFKKPDSYKSAVEEHKQKTIEEAEVSGRECPFKRWDLIKIITGSEEKDAVVGLVHAIEAVRDYPVALWTIEYKRESTGDTHHKALVSQCKLVCAHNEFNYANMVKGFSLNGK